MQKRMMIKRYTSQLTKSLIAYEEKLASKDAGSKIKLLQQQVDAKDAAMTKAIKDKIKQS